MSSSRPTSSITSSHGAKPRLIAVPAQPGCDLPPDPQLVVDAYLALADATPSKRPTRTVVGITWGVDKINAYAQLQKDPLLKKMQLQGVLGGTDA